jgi:peptidyl-prolyl cis-trans isomerase D
MPKNPTPRVISKKHLARVEKERLFKRGLYITTAVILIAVFGLIIYGIVENVWIKPSQPVAQVGDHTISINDFVDRVRLERYMAIRNLELTYNYYQQSIQYINMDIGNYYAKALELSNSLSAANAITFAGNVLDTMIEEWVLEKTARDMGITVSEEEVSAALEADFSYYPNGTPTPTQTLAFMATPTNSGEVLTLIAPPPTNTPAVINTPASTITPTNTLQSSPTPTATIGSTATIPQTTATITLTPTITNTATPFTYESFKNQYDATINTLKNADISETALRSSVYFRVLRSKVLTEIKKQLPLETEHVLVRHILVQDETMAKSILERLTAGDNWYEVGNEFLAQDSSLVQQDLGWMPHGYTVPEFDSAAFALEVGAFSQPVKTQYGWHIIQVLGKEIRPIASQNYDGLAVYNYLQLVQKTKDEIKPQKFDNWQTFAPSDPQFSGTISPIPTKTTNPIDTSNPFP